MTLTTDNTDFNTTAELVADDIANGNLSKARFTLWGLNVAKDDIAPLTLAVVVLLDLRIGCGIPAALERVQRLVTPI